MSNLFKCPFLTIILSVGSLCAALPAYARDNSDGTLAAPYSTKIQVGDLYYELDAGASTGQPGTATVVKPDNGSYNVSTVIIPKSISYDGVEYAVTKIGAGTFEGAKNLTNISIPSNILAIGANAFKGCLSLEELRIEPAEQPLNILDNVFNDDKADLAQFAPLYCYIGRTLNLTPDVQKVSIHFLQYSGVVKCEIENVADITDRYLTNTGTLKQLILHKGVSTIGTLRDCKSLEGITVPEGVTTMADGCFDGCTSLKSAVIPSTMQQMSGFYDSTGLTEVYFYALTPPTTYYDEKKVPPFHANGKGVIHVLPEAVDAYKASLWGNQLDRYPIIGDLTITDQEAKVTLTLQTEGEGNIRIIEADGEAFTGTGTAVSDTEEQTQVPAQSKSVKVVVIPDAGQEITQCEVTDPTGAGLPMSARVAGQSLELEVAPAEGMRVKAAFSPCATSSLRLMLPRSEEETMRLSQSAGNPYHISYRVTPGYRIASVWLDAEELPWQMPPAGAASKGGHENAEVASYPAGAKIEISVPAFEGEKTLRIVEEAIVTEAESMVADNCREISLQPAKGGGAELSGVAPGATVQVTAVDGMILYTGIASSAGILRLPPALKGILLISSPGHQTLRTRL